MTKYKLIQLTNTGINEVATNAFIPLGVVTRRINAPYSTSETFQVTNSTADSVTITEPGFYKVTYNITATAAEVGTVTLELITNNLSVETVSSTITTADDPVNVTLIYTIRVCPNCCSTPTNCPVAVQIQSTGVALSGDTANLIIEKVQ